MLVLQSIVRADVIFFNPSCNPDELTSTLSWMRSAGNSADPQRPLSSVSPAASSRSLHPLSSCEPHTQHECLFFNPTATACQECTSHCTIRLVTRCIHTMLPIYQSCGLSRRQTNSGALRVLHMTKPITSPVVCVCVQDIHKFQHHSHPSGQLRQPRFTRHTVSICMPVLTCPAPMHA